MDHSSPMSPRDNSDHLNHPGNTIGRLAPAIFSQSPLDRLKARQTTLAAQDTPSPQSDSSNSPPASPEQSAPPKPMTMLERHAILPYPTTIKQLPLSIYERPTATFMWARWTPRLEPEVFADSRPPRPVMYVQYRPQKCETESNSAPSRPISPTSVPTSSSSSHPSPILTPPPLPYAGKRSYPDTSDDDESIGSPSDRFIKHSRTSHHDAPRAVSARNDAPENQPEAPLYPLRRLVDKETYRNGIVGAESDYSDAEARPARYHPYPAYQSNSSASQDKIHIHVRSASTVPVDAPLMEDRDDDSARNEWMRYTSPPPETSSGPDFECTWETKLRDGTMKRCGYSSKKHLVKRHIESKHLKLRPCVCHFCGKGFAQKSNLDTHLNTHTGDKPHKCHYCSESFKDPARRHRHMIQTHGHRSSRTKKGRIFPDQPGLASSAEGSEPDIDEPTTPSVAWKILHDDDKDEIEGDGERDELVNFS